MLLDHNNNNTLLLCTELYDLVIFLFITQRAAIEGIRYDGSKREVHCSCQAKVSQRDIADIISGTLVGVETQ